MKLQKKDGNVLTLMLALAFFNFIFLETEYQFDNMAGSGYRTGAGGDGPGLCIGSQRSRISPLPCDGFL